MKSRMSLSLHGNVTTRVSHNTITLTLPPRLRLSSDDSSLAIRQLALLAIIMKGDKYLSSLNEPISAPRNLRAAATSGEWI